LLRAAGSQSFVVRLYMFQKIHQKHKFLTEYRTIKCQAETRSKAITNIIFEEHKINI